MGDGCEEVLLALPELGIVPDGSRQHGHPPDQDEQKETALPRIAVDARVGIRHKCLHGFRAHGSRTQLQVDPKVWHQLRQLCRGLGERCGHRQRIGFVKCGDPVPLLAGKASLVGDPPGHLCGGYGKQREETKLQRLAGIALEYHDSLPSGSSSARSVEALSEFRLSRTSPRATARRSICSGVWASDRKPTS